MNRPLQKQPRRRRSSLIGLALAVLGALLVTTTSCQLQIPAMTGQAASANAELTQPRPNSGPTAAAISAALPSGDTLQLIVGGVPRPFSSGDSIPIAGDVSASVVVTVPDTTPYSRSVDLYVYHERDRQPIDDVHVQATVHMIYMEHGTAQPAVERGDAGHYIVPVQFAMAGEWELDVMIATADGRGTFALAFGVYQ